MADILTDECVNENQGNYVELVKFILETPNPGRIFLEELEEMTTEECFRFYCDCYITAMKLYNEFQDLTNPLPQIQDLKPDTLAVLQNKFGNALLVLPIVDPVQPLFGPGRIWQIDEDDLFACKLIDFSLCFSLRFESLSEIDN